MNHKIQKPFWRKLLRFFAIASLLCIVATVAVVTVLIIQLPELPTYEDVKATHQPSDAVLLDRNGDTIQRIRVDFDVRRGNWTELEDISPAMIKALLVSEDKRFYDHPGVDILAIAAATRMNLTGQAARGASTITMQLVGMMDEKIGRSGKRSLWQKLRQASVAIALEKTWSKEQIMEAYLNRIPFRGELVGIDALSQGLFHKSANALNAREAAVAAAMIRAPNVSEQTISRRACTILEDMQADNFKEECALLDNFIHVRFNQPRLSPAEGLAPHLALKLLGNESTPANKKPRTIKTTLDTEVQRIATQSLRRHLLELRHKNVEDGAVIVIDNATGEVLAWVGSSGQGLSQAAELDVITAMRQPGSTLKPFLFALAIEQKRLTAASLLNDTAVNLNVGSGLYVPQNYDKSYKGWVSTRTALASSLNIPSVRTLVMIGPEVFANSLLKLGLPLEKSGDFYGYSLALGSAEVTLLTLTNAYRSLANQGQVNSVRWLDAYSNTPENISAYALEIPAHTSDLSPQTCWIIGSILSDRQARATTFGLDSVLNTRYWSAIKTGTSKDMRDNWAIGYTPRYTVGVWVGNASGAAMWGISGTSGAAPVWHDVMDFLYHRDIQNGYAAQWQAPPTPEGVIGTQIQYIPAIEPTRTEWFIEGTERETIQLSGQAQNDNMLNEKAVPKILEPTSGTIIALDPDIPPQNQLIRFISNHRNVQWQIDRDIMGQGQTLDWPPLPGRHKINLLNAEGEILDSIRIEIRGGSLKPSIRPQAPQPDMQ